MELNHNSNFILRPFQNLSLPKILLYRANRTALYFLPNDPIGTCSTGGHLGLSSINNRRTATIFFRFLAYFLEANLSSTSLPSISWKYSKTFHQQPEKFKDFSSAPENIQRLSRLQICLSRKSSTIFRKNSKTFWTAINSSNQQQQITAATSSSNQQQQPAAAISSSNQQQQSAAAANSSNQQQQPPAAINSSNQQQQSAAATNSSNQQQQPTTATSSSDQQQSTSSNTQPAATINTSNDQLSSYQQYLYNPRRLPLVTNTVPSRGYALLEVELGLAARLRVPPPLSRLIFCDFPFF